MLNIHPLDQAQKTILDTCTKKVNELYIMLNLYNSSPDTFWTDYHLKSVLQWFTTIISKGDLKGGINLVPPETVDQEPVEPLPDNQPLENNHADIE